MSSISDNFDRSNNTDINTGSGLSWSWTETVTDWEILNNQLSVLTTGGGIYVRAESDLATADHEASFDVTVTNNVSFTSFGPIVRMSSSANSGFLVRAVNDNVTVQLQMYRVDAGVLTQLGSDVDITSSYVAGRTVKARAVGTTITGYYNSSALITQTATEYSSNLRTGARGFNGGTGSSGDNFIAQDVGSTTAGSLVDSVPLKSLVNGGLVS